MKSSLKNRYVRFVLIALFFLGGAHGSATKVAARTAAPPKWRRALQSRHQWHRQHQMQPSLRRRARSICPYWLMVRSPPPLPLPARPHS